MCKQIHTQVSQSSLADVYHDPVVGKCTQHPHRVDPDQRKKRLFQRPEIRIRCFGHGNDIFIDQFLHKQGSAQGSQRCSYNTDHYHSEKPFIIFHHISQSPLQDLSRIVHLGSGTADVHARAFYCLYIFCHYAAPPVFFPAWSKSPPPLICVS